MSKKRLDLLMVKKGFAESRNRAQAYILEGKVFVNGQKHEKAGTLFEEDVKIETTIEEHQWVSRGAFKLIKGLDEFSVDPAGSVCLDVGSSTGGFCHVLLERNAEKIYSVDVGYGQLAWQIRNDPRVIVLERTNARYLDSRIIPEEIDLSTVDVSFISLKKILPSLSKLIHEEGTIIALVKPQFEAGKGNIGKKGVIKDPEVHVKVLVEICSFIRENLGIDIYGISYSPVKGPKGNIEYLICLKKDNNTGNHYKISAETIEKTVSEAHMKL